MAELKVDHRLRLILTGLIVLIPLGVGWYMLWRHFAAPDTSKYEPIVQQLQDGKLTVGLGSKILIGNSFPGVTPRDEFFAEHRADSDLWLALFPTYYGQADALGAVLYVSRPLKESDTYPPVESHTFDERVIDVGVWKHMHIDKRLSEHWYRVSRKL